MEFFYSYTLHWVSKYGLYWDIIYDNDESQTTAVRSRVVYNTQLSHFARPYKQ